MVCVLRRIRPAASSQHSHGLNAPRLLTPHLLPEGNYFPHLGHLGLHPLCHVGLEVIEIGSLWERVAGEAVGHVVGHVCLAAGGGQHVEEVDVQVCVQEEVDADDVILESWVHIIHMSCIPPALLSVYQSLYMIADWVR